jgi:ribose 5-phosphate isomerase B
MRLVIGSDHFGYGLKAELRAHLEQRGHELLDLGCTGVEDEVDYPDVAEALARRIAAGEFARGILVCGTGIGMAIAANKVPGVRAACCHDPYSAERARKSNDAQVLCLGAEIVGAALARVLLDHWLESEFGGGRSTRKVHKLAALDQRYHAPPAPARASE